MTQTARKASIALLCTPDDRVRRILRDEIGVSGSFKPGQRLLHGLDEASRQKAQTFLSMLQRDHAAFDWQLNVLVTGGALLPLHMAGIAVLDGYLIVGAQSISAAALTLDALIPHYKTEAEAALRELLRWAAERGQSHAELYDELSRLNNDLITAQRELARRNAELVQLNSEKNKLLGMAAHDLRNPLSVILNYSELLLGQSDVALDPGKRRFIQGIHRSSELMLSVVDDFLDVSKIEADGLVLNRVPTDLDALVQENVELNQTLAGPNRVRLSYAAKAELPNFLLDPAKINQVLNNLLGNAIKVSPPGSTIKVELTRAPDGALIRVADQGPGIHSDQQDVIFQPFHQGQLFSDKGAGLGLAIASGIVRAHGGRIWVESHPPEGPDLSFDASARPRGI